MEHVGGFDYVRVVACLFVVVLHTDPFGVMGSPLLLFNVFYSAVPLFFLVSLFLFGQKDVAGYLSKRLKKLAFLYIIGSLVSALWVGEGIIYKIVNPGYNTYWFLFDLFCLTGILSFWRRYMIRHTYSALFVSCGVVVALSFSNISWSDTPSGLWNFMPLIFLSIIVGEYRNPLVFGVVAVVAIVCEWMYLPYISPYTRLSVIFSAASVVVLALRFRGLTNQIIRTISKNTLGIFFFHTYFASMIPNGVGAFVVAFLGSLLLSMMFSRVYKL